VAAPAGGVHGRHRKSANRDAIWGGSFSLFDHYYQAILGRAPDAEGKASGRARSARMQSLGIDVKEAYMLMAGCLLTAPNTWTVYTSDAQYVADLYNAFFNRAPERRWAQLLDQPIAAGVPRSIVKCSFLFSPEFNSFMTGCSATPAAGPRCTRCLISTVAS
jgi:hypothetical protein